VDPLRFSFQLSDFDLDLLPIDPQVLRSNPGLLRDAVKAYYNAFFKRAGGELNVVMDGDLVSVSWLPAAPDQPETLVDCAVSLLQQGAYKEAERILRPLFLRFPDNTAVLYNLGMMLSDQRKIPEALRLLTRLTQLSPTYANGWIALGVACQRGRDPVAAKEAFQKSLLLEPESPYALRNLGALLASEDPAASLPLLRRAAELLPEDQGALYGYGTALVKSGNVSDGDAYLKRAMDVAPNTQIAELCRKERTEIANRALRSGALGGLRMDAVMYCLSALKQYAELGPEKTQAITFEIAMLGRSGLDSNDPARKYHLRSLPGTFSGLQLVCLMYVGFKQIEPEMDIGFDLSKEFEAAKSMLQLG